MINFKSFDLDNRLKVLVHEDHDTNLVVMNILYDVGSRDEHPEKTGFAHLFEHLMFGGSRNIPSYDVPLQAVGGDNNAFTSTDLTNYYLTVPSNNIETAFWLESDRMLSLSFDPQVLEIQRNVVIEEYKQRYLNQPYGDVWLKLKPLAYHQHPYKWLTIGKDIAHIENVTMKDVRDFFYRYYIPSNAIVVLAGDITIDEVKSLSEKWFGSIESNEKPLRNIPPEPLQTEQRRLEIEADVPTDALYKVYHMSGCFSEEYHSQDLLSDVIGRGKSSPLYQELIIKKKIFSSLNAYVTGSIDPGLLVINGKLNDGIGLEDAESEIDEITSKMDDYLTESILQKVKNQAEASLTFSEVELLNRAMNLAYATLSGDPNNVNNEIEKIKKVKKEEILEQSAEIFQERNSSVLYYKSAGQ